MDKSNKTKAIDILYNEIYKFERLGDFEKTLKCSNKLIQNLPDKSIGYECKVISLIQLSRFEDALKLLKDKETLLMHMKFEKAYCFYRTNNLKDAHMILSTLDVGDSRVLELKAQVYYRLEKYEDALAMYDAINRLADDDYESERHTNLSAVIALIDDSDKTKVYMSSIKDDSYEVCFNKAIMYANKNVYEESDNILKKAETLCREMLDEDGVNEDEYDIELANVQLLAAYNHHVQDRISEANQLYNGILKLKVDDVAVTAVASNNIVAINKDENIFDSKKRLKTATSEGVEHKLPSKQRKYVALNNAIFNFYIGKYDVSNKICDSIKTQWPELSFNCDILYLLNTCKANKKINYIDIFKNHNIQNPTDFEKLYLKLALVQLLLLEGNLESACRVLDDLGDEQYKPGIVGLRITIYLTMGKEDIALKLFEDALQWYRKNKVSGTHLTNLWRQAAEFHIKNARYQVAANSLEELLATNPDDRWTLSQLVLAYVRYDRIKAIESAKRLGDPQKFIAQCDLQNIESSVWLAVKKGTVKIEVSPGVTQESTKKKHRKKKVRLPKYYNSEVQPDPERWLPKYERSGYKKKKDKRLKNVESIKGSQGSSSNLGEQFDFSSKIGAEHEDAPTNDVISPKARKQQKWASNPKKKGKRR